MDPTTTASFWFTLLGCQSLFGIPSTWQQAAPHSEPTLILKPKLWTRLGVHERLLLSELEFQGQLPPEWLQKAERNSLLVRRFPIEGSLVFSSLPLHVGKAPAMSGIDACHSPVFTMTWTTAHGRNCSNTCCVPVIYVTPLLALAPAAKRQNKSMSCNRQLQDGAILLAFNQI